MLFPWTNHQIIVNKHYQPMVNLVVNQADVTAIEHKMLTLWAPQPKVRKADQSTSVGHLEGSACQTIFRHLRVKQNNFDQSIYFKNRTSEWALCKILFVKYWLARSHYLPVVGLIMHTVGEIAGSLHIHASSSKVRVQHTI